MRTALQAASVALFITKALGHGNITSPPARLPGPAMMAACGIPAIQAVLADGTTPLEDVPTTAAGPDCQLALCRGAKFADNRQLVQTYAPGQIVRFNAILPILHEGPMNVSIVDTRTNTVIGPPLISFRSYADESLRQIPANNTDFSVRMPVMETGQCRVPGQCVMQWFWVGTRASQTYESCIDFVMAPVSAIQPPAPPIGGTFQ